MQLQSEVDEFSIKATEVEHKIELKMSGAAIFEIETVDHLGFIRIKYNMWVSMLHAFLKFCIMVNYTLSALVKEV